jgi:hypothetical protein
VTPVELRQWAATVGAHVVPITQVGSLNAADAMTLRRVANNERKRSET